MAFRHKYTLMCDEIRQENNGKFILLGLYTPDMMLAQLPALIPCLTFLNFFEADRLGAFTQKMSLQSLENGKVVASGTNMLEVRPAPNPEGPWNVLSAANFRNIMIDHAGTYTFTLALEGERDPIVYQFNIGLAVPNPAGMPPGLAIRRQ